MTDNSGFIDRYRTGETPWDLGRPDYNLINTVTMTPIQPCKAFDIGCGTGENVIWLKMQKFDAGGGDLSEIAVEKARQKAEKLKLDCKFQVIDIMHDDLPAADYDLIFDRGCFHTFDEAEERLKFAERVHRHLKNGGLWLSLIGNDDEPRGEQGPPKRSAIEIVNSVTPCFELIFMKSGHFDSNFEIPPRIWICLMKKRIG